MGFCGKKVYKIEGWFRENNRFNKILRKFLKLEMLMKGSDILFEIDISWNWKLKVDVEIVEDRVDLVESW
jgi:hypothetical protein